MKTDICVASGGTTLRLPSPINHKIYAEMHGLDYRLETGSSGTLKNRYYFKLEVLRRLLPRYDWVLWIDDDAFFTDFAVDIRKLCETKPATMFLLLADGRVKPGGAWTQINSGVMLVRNCAEALAFLQTCLTTDIETVRAWWNASDHGMFTQSDQDTLLYHILRSADRGPFEITPHLGLNARPYHYSSRFDEHFICHFPGLSDKLGAIRQFGERFAVGPTLVPPALLRTHGFQENAGDNFLPLPKRSFRERIKRRLRRFVTSVQS